MRASYKGMQHPFLYSSLLLLPAILSTTAIAQSQIQEKPALEEVLVTATKTGKTNLQQTPISMTAISGDELGLSNIENIRNLNLLAPGVTIGQNGSYGQLYIRGIGTNNVFAGGDPSSTIHLDGVYLGRPSSVFMDFLELERVEVLRGPQGTLYGRNSTGGTINLITQKPNQDFFAKGTVDFGSYTKRNIDAVINGSLGSDKVSGNLAVSTAQRDGYIDNQNPTGNPELNDEDRQNVRAALRYVPVESLTIDVAADYFERDETTPQYKPTGQEAIGKRPAIPPKDIKDFWTLDLSHDPRLEERSKGFNTTIDWQVSEKSAITSISGYREFQTELLADTDYSELPIITSQFVEDQDQTSQEFQYRFQSDKITLVTGIYYYSETVDVDSTISALALGARNHFVRTAETTSVALFADIGWQITDRLELLAGGRYTDEEKDFSGRVTIETPPTPSDEIQDEKESWTDFSPKVGAKYTLSDDTMLFGTITQGFKSGGYNFTSPDSVPQSFDPEELISYEAGLKMDFPDARMRLNTSIFYYDYTDLQVLSFAELGKAIEISNASDAEVSGLELELLTDITDQWRVSGAVTFLSAKYEDYTGQRNTDTLPDLIDLSGNYLNSAPKSTFSLVTDYTQALSTGNLLYRLEYYWQNKIYFTAFNDDITSQDSYGLLSASISFNAPDDSWQIKVYGKNLTNEEYSVSKLDFPPTGVANSISEPVTYGVKATYRFE